MGTDCELDVISMNFVKETKLCYVDLANEIDVNKFTGLHFHGVEEYHEVRVKIIAAAKKVENE